MKDKLIRMLELVEAREKDLCFYCVHFFYEKCQEMRVKYSHDSFSEIKFCSDWEEREV